MSHLRECLRLYRDDIEVNDEQFAKIILDAHARDLNESIRDTLLSRAAEYAEHVPLSQDERDQMNERAADLLAEQGYVVNDRSGLRDLARNVDLANLMSPEESARYLLVQFRSVQETLDLLAAADGGLIALDTKREIAIDALDERLDQLERRMDLRADECRAMDKRIDNLDLRTNLGRPLRPV